MDLAKIRQKARQGRNEKLLVVDVQPPKENTVVASPVEEVRPPIQAESMYDLFFDQPSGNGSAVPSNRNISHPRRKTPFNPVEILLAGREAAGCDEDLQLTSVEQADAAVEDYEEFLCIRVSNEIYGINIMQIKEIIKPREVTEIPRSPSFVYGVISLRGVIIPIVDMLDRLGLGHETATGRERVVVVKHADEFTGLLVDEVIQVVRIAKDSFEPAPSVLEGINRDFVCGIGRADNRMIIMLNLDTITDINLY
ncbi:MAG TPA: chemotaxis protein CheW [Desulfuromonadaceae bacterium]|jgi:purine-binding chemotaxis protein CheW